MERELRHCRNLLPSVSRTFALTIQVLPEHLRDSVTVAYLLCRLADQVEDATRVDPACRVQALEALAQAMASSSSDPADLAGSLDPIEGWFAAEPESVPLLERRLCLFQAFVRLSQAEREVIARWTEAMALGMSTYVARESARGAQEVPFVLQTEEDLRSYAYYVAGTVGHMLTDLFALRLGRRAGSLERLRELAVPFGLGLQFTNILQDLAEDRRRGWSYVPEDLARRHGITVRGLDRPEFRPAALRVVGDLVREAAGYLDRAMEYTLLLPPGAPRIRLFCTWPIFFAVRTLVRVWGEERILTGGEKVRITRPEVRRIISSTAAACLWNGSLASLYRRERERLEKQILLRPV